MVEGLALENYYNEICTLVLARSPTDQDAIKTKVVSLINLSKFAAVSAAIF